MPARLPLFSDTKGQLISKCLFGVFNFFQKMNENKSTWGVIVHSKVEFVCSFLEETSAWKNHFDYVWPLEAPLALEGSGSLKTMIIKKLTKMMETYLTKCWKMNLRTAKFVLGSRLINLPSSSTFMLRSGITEKNETKYFRHFNRLKRLLKK